MNTIVELVLVTVVMTNLVLLGTTRVGACIRLVAVQGLILGVLPLVVHHGAPDLHLAVTSVVTLVLRAAVFPWLLHRAMVLAGTRDSRDPGVSTSTSVLLGVLFLGYAIWLGTRLPLAVAPDSPLIVPVALATILSGLFLIVARRMALMQVAGYLVLENGMFTFAVGAMLEEDMLMQLGVLLDVFVLLFVMGIIFNHISSEFEHLGGDVDRMAELREGHE